MSRVCKITGKRPSAGNQISHSQRHTKRRFLPNVKKKRIILDGKPVRIKLSMRALRTLAKHGRLG